MAAPHPCARQAASSGQGLLLRGIFPPAYEVHFSSLSPGAGQRDSGTHPRPSPDRRGALLQVLPTPRWALGTAAGLARFPASLRQPQPCLPVLAAHAQKHTTKITPLGIAPKGRTKAGAWKPGRNKCAWMPRRAGLGAAKLLAGGEGGGSAAPGAALRDRAREGGPRPPRPSPPPPRAAAPARTPAPAAAAPASAPGWGGAWPLRQVAGNGSRPRRGPGRSAQQPLPLGAPG